MLKKFLKNIALVLFLNLLIKPFWILGIDRTVQNVVGVADYGFYYSIFSFSFLLNILLDFGITNFNNKNIAITQDINENLLVELDEQGDIVSLTLEHAKKNTDVFDFSYQQLATD